MLLCFGIETCLYCFMKFSTVIIFLWIQFFLVFLFESPWKQTFRFLFSGVSKLKISKKWVYKASFSNLHESLKSWVGINFIISLDKNIFGVPLLTIAERTGSPLPHTVLLAINYLSRLAVDNVGIFRKSGMKSRIEKLRNLMENNPEKVDFDGYSVYDVADTLKQYFRELPEPLLTTKLADTFISIHKGRKIALQYCFIYTLIKILSQPAFTCSKSKREAPKQNVKYVKN